MELDVDEPGQDLTYASDQIEDGRMFKSLLGFLGMTADSTELDKFEPIYGLPKRSLDEWLSRNPKLKKEYERELVVRLQRSRVAREARSHRHEWAMRSWRYLVHAARSLQLLARRSLSVVFAIIHDGTRDNSLAHCADKSTSW
jgi:hypothetical protein